MNKLHCPKCKHEFSDWELPDYSLDYFNCPVCDVLLRYESSEDDDPDYYGGYGEYISIERIEDGIGRSERWIPNKSDEE